MNLVGANTAEAGVDVPASASLALGGIGLRDIPSVLVEELCGAGATGLEAVSTLVPNDVAEDVELVKQSENGILAASGQTEEVVDVDLIEVFSVGAPV